MKDFEYRWCLNEPDYHLVIKWLTSWKFEALPRNMLSEYGAIVSKDGVDLCSGWLYQSDSKIAWIEWVVINKEAPKNLRNGCVDFLYDTLFSKAKELGFDVVMSFVKHGMFKDKLETKYGFKPCGDNNMELMFKSLWVQ